MVMVLEVVVDSIKHAFITKFNDISPGVYKKYRTLLAMDLVTRRQDNVSTPSLGYGIRVHVIVGMGLGQNMYNPFQRRKIAESTISYSVHV